MNHTDSSEEFGGLDGYDKNELSTIMILKIIGDMESLSLVTSWNSNNFHEKIET